MEPVAVNFGLPSHKSIPNAGLHGIDRVLDPFKKNAALSLGEGAGVELAVAIFGSVGLDGTKFSGSRVLVAQ